MRKLATLVLVVVPAAAQAHKPTTTKFTYHRDVYPIFLARCGSCHQTGGVAPMSLLTYKETYPWAVAIKNEVLGLSMPPWFADGRYGEFRHENALTASEVNTIVDWCIGGTPEGESSGAPPPVDDASSRAGWPLGEPDLVLPMPEPYVLPAGENEAAHEVTLPTGLSRDRLVRAFDFRPGSPNVVRSALVFVPRDGSAAPDGLVATWIAGGTPESLPEGTGIRLRRMSALVLEVHYKKTWLDEGKDVSDRSELAVYFHEKRKGRLVEPLAVTGPEGGTVRPKGAGFETVLERPLPKSVDVVALVPRVGARIASLHAEAVLPGGGSVGLIRLTEPDPGWPRKFWLTDPLPLPKGSRVRVTLTAPEEAPLRDAHFLVLDVVSR